MLIAAVTLTMITTSLLTWALFNFVFGVFANSSGGGVVLQKLQRQMGQDSAIIEEKNVDAEDVTFTKLKINITSLIKRFFKIPLVTNILLTPENLKNTEEKLMWAGYPFGFSADQWISMNIFLFIVVGLYFFFMYVSGLVSIIAIIIVFAALLLLPNMWLKNKIKARSQEMEKELPNIINKLVLATMSSAQIITALNMVVKHTNGILTDEIKKTLSIYRMAGGDFSLEEAFWDMSHRCGNQQVTSFCTAIINSTKIKSSVNNILEEQVENMKESRKARNEEIINKTDTLLMASAALGVMAVLIVSMAPGVVMIMQGF